MINFTNLLCGLHADMDHLRYDEKTIIQRKPIVVWNSTRRCNLKCVHCYADSDNQEYKDELTTKQAKEFIVDLAEFKVPVLLFSGGEPLLRQDLCKLAAFASEKGIRPVISTNGTLITKEKVKELKKAGILYAGVSIDGMSEINDKFRGKKSAFDMALKGIRNCLAGGVKVGLRMTVTKHNYHQVGDVIDLIEKEGIPRACFYHLVYSGRGSELIKEDITNDQTRKVIDLISDRVIDMCKNGIKKEILTVDNHTDGVYLYIKLKKTDPEKAKKVYQLLKVNGGNSSGVGIADISNTGEVYADQFWRTHCFGNIKKRKFSEIWTDTTNPLMAKLKNRKQYLKGKCGICKYVDICNGNFRARAEAVHNDIWQEDPACYLTEEEILRNY